MTMLENLTERQVSVIKRSKASEASVMIVPMLWNRSRCGLQSARSVVVSYVNRTNLLGQKRDGRSSREIAVALDHILT